MKPPTMSIMAPLMAAEWKLSHSFILMSSGSVRCGNRIVAITGTATVLVAIAV